MSRGLSNLFITKLKLINVTSFVLNDIALLVQIIFVTSEPGKRTKWTVRATRSFQAKE